MRISDRGNAPGVVCWAGACSLLQKGLNASDFKARLVLGRISSSQIPRPAPSGIAIRDAKPQKGVVAKGAIFGCLNGIRQGFQLRVPETRDFDGRRDI
jgi:hypothetical protein